MDVITREERRLAGCRRSGTAYIAASLTEDAFYFTGVTQDGSNLYRLHWDGGEATGGAFTVQTKL